MSFLNSIKALDVFGYAPNLSFKDSTTFNTKLGGIINLVILMFGLFASIFFGRELWERRNPITNISTESDLIPKPKKYFLDYQFILGIQSQINIDSYFIDETIYSVKAFLFEYSLNTSSFIITNIMIDRCTKDSFDKNHFDLFSQFNYKNSWCLLKNQNVTVEKLYGQDGFKMLRVNVIPCKNTTLFNKCAPQELIKGHLEGTFASIFALNNNIQSGNYKNPLQNTVENYFSTVSLSTSVDMAIKMRTTEFKSDTGFLIENFEYNTGFINEYPMITTAPYKGDYIFSVNFQCFSKKDVVSRSYYKLQTLLAQIGGLVNSLYIFSRLLINAYNKYYFNIALFNELFYVNNETNEDRLESKVHIINFSRVNLVKYNFAPPNKGKQIQISFCKSFFMKLCKKGENINEVYNVYTSVFSKKFNIVNFIKMNYELDRLKYFLFDSDERQILDHLRLSKLPLSNTNLQCYKEKENYYSYLLRFSDHDNLEDVELKNIINNLQKNIERKNKKLIELF